MVIKSALPNVFSVFSVTESLKCSYKFCYESELLEDISQYTGDDEPVYCFEVTDNKFLNDLGVKDNGKLYIALRSLNYDRLEDQDEINKHNNAKKVIKYIIDNK